MTEHGSKRGEVMANRTLGLCLIVGCVCIIASLRPANAGTPSEAQTLRRIMLEVEELKADKQQDEKTGNDTKHRNPLG